MQKLFQSGEVVRSLAGRDKGSKMLIIEVGENFALVVDGKSRKTTKPKKKNLKHIEKISSATVTELANKIAHGAPVSNGRLKKALCTATEKI